MFLKCSLAIRADQLALCSFYVAEKVLDGVDLPLGGRTAVCLRISNNVDPTLRWPGANADSRITLGHSLMSTHIVSVRILSPEAGRGVVNVAYIL